LQSVSKWQCNKVDWSEKNADVSTLIGCHGNVPKKLNEVNKRFHPPIDPEILVKIGPLGSELPTVKK